eukprot:scaffold1237_cov243-Pinguiococcus_pyrenoidosus.AAC.27
MASPFAASLSANPRPVVMKPPPTAIEPKPKNAGTQGALAQSHRPGCNCRRSKCLKLYCVCFAAKQICVASCNCQMCHNSREHEADRQKAIHSILERNPTAFDAKFAGSEARTADATSRPGIRHKRGCRCRKSGCLKKYCECFQAHAACGERCSCIDCKNMGPRNPPHPGSSMPGSAASAPAPVPSVRPKVPLAPAESMPPAPALENSPWPAVAVDAAGAATRGSAEPIQTGTRHRKRARSNSYAQKKTQGRSPRAAKGQKLLSINSGLAPEVLNPSGQTRSASAPAAASQGENSYSILDAAEDLAFLKAGTPSPRKATRSVTADASLSHVLKPEDAMSGAGLTSDLSNLLALSSAATSVATSPVSSAFQGIGGSVRSSPLSTLLAAESELSGSSLDALRGSPSFPVSAKARTFFPAPAAEGATAANGAPRPSPYESWKQDGAEAIACLQIEEGEGFVALMTLAGKTSLASPGAEPSIPAPKRPLSNVVGSGAGSGKRSRPHAFGQDETEGFGSTDGSASSDSGDEVANAHLSRQSAHGVHPPLQIVQEHV